MDALWKAVFQNNYDQVLSQLKQGADVNTSHMTESVLYLASEKGNLDIVNLLLEWNADINSQDMVNITPLMIATQHGNIDVVATLLKHGANTNYQSVTGLTALHRVTDIESARLLLDAGCDLTLVNKEGNTAEAHLRNKGRPDIADFIRHYDGVPIKEPDGY